MIPGFKNYKFIAVIVLGAAIFSSLGCLYGVFRESGWMYPCLLLAVIANILAWLPLLNGPRSGYAVLGLLATLSIPLLGPVLSSLILLWTSLFEPPEVVKGEVGHDEVRLFRIRKTALESFQTDHPEEFVSAAALLENGTPDERRGAIEVLAQIGGPEQIALLQKCLDDEEREIYQLAHAKLTQLHERFTGKIRQAQQSNDAELIDSLISYLDSGLLSDASMTFYRHQAIETAERLLQAGKQDSQLFSTLGELYLEDDKPELAHQSFTSALAADEECLDGHWGMTRVYYHRREFEKLQPHLAALRRIYSSGTSPPAHIAAVINWWFRDQPQEGALS